MNKVIKEVKKDVVQITTCDERWYSKQTNNKVTGLPQIEFVPSVTWIAEHYPKGIYFYKWLASKGWDEAEAIKQAAGDKGSKVHHAIWALLNGEEVKMEAEFINPSTEKLEPLTLQEYECLMSFVAWHKVNSPEDISGEMVVFNNKQNYAGTIDRIFRLDGKVYIIDFKTSANIWPSHEMQLSAYSHASIDIKELGIKDKEWAERKLAILQLGYKKNRMGYKFTDIVDKFDLFLHAKAIWLNECAKIEPKQRDYPLTLKLGKGEQNVNSKRK